MYEFILGFCAGWGAVDIALTIYKLLKEFF